MRNELAFSELLSPLQAEVFLSRNLGREPCLVRGKPGKFAEVFGWEPLTTALCTRWLDYPRIRLVKNGRTLPPDIYVERTNGRRGLQHASVNLEAVKAEMKAGAMLHLASVEELYEPVWRLAATAREMLHGQVFVNAHAGLQASRGFDTHWDGHDVFVLQISGIKHWRMFGATEVAPLAVSPDEKGRGPASPLWEADLHDGDLLYLPRGYWHSAQALDQPTLHLTLGVVQPTGTDFLNWMTGRLARDNDAFRSDLPEFRETQEQEDFVRRLMTELNSRLTLSQLQEFLRQHTESCVAQRTLKLP